MGFCDITSDALLRVLGCQVVGHDYFFCVSSLSVDEAEVSMIV